MGIIASPVSVAVVSLVAMLGNVTFERASGVHSICCRSPSSTLLDTSAIGIFSWFRGKIWIKTKRTFQKFISVPENRQYVYGDTATLLDKNCRKQLAGDVDLLAAAIAVVLCRRGLRLTSTFGGKPLSMVLLVIQMFMLLTGAHYHPDQKPITASITKTKFFVPV